MLLLDGLIECLMDGIFLPDDALCGLQKVHPRVDHSYHQMLGARFSIRTGVRDSADARTD